MRNPSILPSSSSSWLPSFVASSSSISRTYCGSAAYSSSSLATDVSTRVQRALNVPRNWSLEGAPIGVFGIIGRYLGESSDVLTFIKTLPQGQRVDTLLQIIHDPQSNSSIINHILHEAEYALEDTQRSFLLLFSRTVGIRQVPFIRDLFPTVNAMEFFTKNFMFALHALQRLECQEIDSSQLQRLRNECSQLHTVVLKSCYLLNDNDLLRLSGLPLRSLSLSGCSQITDTGLSHLYELPLQRIWIYGTAVTPFGIDQLQNHRPGIEIVDYKKWNEQREIEIGAAIRRAKYRTEGNGLRFVMENRL